MSALGAGVLLQGHNESQVSLGYVSVLGVRCYYRVTMDPRSVVEVMLAVSVLVSGVLLQGHNQCTF